MSSGVSNAVSFVLKRLPTLAVLALLGGAAYWGHHNGWKAPKFSEVFGAARVAVDKEDWCSEHNVPESKCIACNPALAGC